MENYVIQRINPRDNYAVSIFCTLPGLSKKKVSGIGVAASFGPTGSPFAGKLYASPTLVDRCTSDLPQTVSLFS